MYDPDLFMLANERSIFASTNEDNFPSSNYVRSLYTYWKICGFPETHGTHANPGLDQYFLMVIQWGHIRDIKRNPMTELELPCQMWTP